MKSSRILTLMFGVGCYALLAQILLLREFLVVFFGNELVIGAVFSVWLILIAVGSYLAAFIVARWPEERLRVLLVFLLALAAVLLPLQVGFIRCLRSVLHVAYGEYVPFVPMLGGLASVLAPSCLIIGIIFPCACRLAAGPLPYAVSRVYTVESLGSMAAGAAFSFWLVWALSPLAVTALAVAIILLGAAWLAKARICRWLLGMLALIFVVGACWPACLAPLERAGAEVRWRSFGALPASGAAVQSTARLRASCDSRYQNLALIETEGQMALYANGQVLTVFPDAITGEHKVHFIMAQKPDARRVLLIGGNPVDDIPELLKYPLEQLVYVELDAEISRLLAPVATSAYRQALRDPRLVQVHMDAPRYVKQYGRHAPGIIPFDAILVDAPEPATIAINRYYTKEFYRDIRAILAPGGFFYTSIAASEDLQSETAFLSASIYAALGTVFDRVLVTAGTKNQFIAGANASPITFARTALFQRSAAAAIPTSYFRSAYFLNADDISPEKLAFVERRLAAIPTAANTIMKPVSTFYQIALWSRLSGSGLESMLARLARLRLGWVAGGLLAFGALLFGIGAALGRRQAGACAVPAFSRIMLVLAMATTGLCGMAMELILVFMFQALRGYVYSKVGLIVAVFMLGLTLGACGAPRLLRRSVRFQWGAMIGMEAILILELFLIPCLMNAFAAGLLNWISWGGMEALIYGLIAGCGALVGAQFALVNELLQNVAPVSSGRDTAGAGQGVAAALVNAADLVGAALGGLVVGVMLLPLFGMAASCILLATLKLTSLLGLLAAQRAGRPLSRSQAPAVRLQPEDVANHIPNRGAHGI